MQYLTVQIMRTERKTSLITVFPHLLKITAKKTWRFRKEKGKVVSSNFQEKLNWEKARKTMMKVMLSASPSLFFSRKVHNIRFEKQIRVLSQLTVIELGRPVSVSSTKILKFHDPTDSEHKFYKKRIENWLSIGFKLGITWQRTYSHNHYTMVCLQYHGES